jgi:hypothetical protein
MAAKKWKPSPNYILRSQISITYIKMGENIIYMKFVYSFLWGLEVCLKSEGTCLEVWSPEFKL